MNINAALLVQDLQNPDVHRAEATETLQSLSLSDFRALLEQTLSAVKTADESADHSWLQPVCEALAQRLQPIPTSNDVVSQTTQTAVDDSETVNDITHTIDKLYSELGPHHAPRYQLLTCLAQIGTHDADDDFPPPVTRNSLSMLADKMVDDPPLGIGPATAPLVQLCRRNSNLAVDALFPRLLDALANPDVAPAVLDLAGFLVRTGQSETHPARQRIDGLLTLAEAVVADLEPLQDGSIENVDELRSRQERVARTLPLAISLCDALGLIGDDRALPTLERIGELKHRRLRVEAAAARVRLVQQSTHEIDATKEEWLSKATKDLVDMAAESSVRMRVLAYAEELELIENVAEEFETPVARAEGELVAFLSQPTQMGLPPDRCELVDAKTLYWPSYEEPRNCYLFRFEYQVQSTESPSGTSTYANLGLAGPTVHAFHTDFRDAPIEDVYSAFAGWQAEHEEIRHREIDANAEIEHLPEAVRDLIGRLPEDFVGVQPRIFGVFFNQPVVIAAAQKGTAIGSLVIDDQMHEPVWYPIVDERSIGAGEAWLIYKGRRLLDSFNDEWTID